LPEVANPSKPNFAGAEMHADLIELNNRIAARTGLCENFMALSSSLLSICVGRLCLSSAQLILLSATHSGRANAQDVICINRDYLQHARLVAQRIVSGVGYSGLLELGINMEQAHVLANLSNTQISQIAKYSDQEVFQRMAPVVHLTRLHSSARPRFAAALIAT